MYISILFGNQSLDHLTPPPPPPPPCSVYDPDATAEVCVDFRNSFPMFPSVGSFHVCTPLFM